MPDWNDAVRGRLVGLNLAGAREAEIVEELSHHLDDRYHELRSEGLPDEEARALAVGELETREVLATDLRKARVAAARDRKGLRSERRGSSMESVSDGRKVADGT